MSINNPQDQAFNDQLLKRLSGGNNATGLPNGSLTATAQPITTRGKNDDPTTTPPPETTPPPATTPPTPDPTTTPPPTTPPPDSATQPKPTPGFAFPTNPTTDPNEIRQVIQKWAYLHPGHNPSVDGDTAYWVKRMLETHPDGKIDWGYWERRMMQPEGPPEGSTGTPGATGNPAPGQQLNYQQQLDYVKGKLGSALTPDEMAKVRARFGGTEKDTADTAMLDGVVTYVRSLRGTTGSTTAPPPGGGGGSGGPGGGLGSQADALFKYLMDRAHQSENVSPDDPTIKSQVDAYASKEIDTSRNELSALAEKGGANFNPDAANRSVTERLGKNTAEFQGGLMSRELQSRRDEISQALTTGANLLTSEQSLALQRELHLLDLLQNESQFKRNLAERGFEFGALNNP